MSSGTAASAEAEPTTEQVLDELSRPERTSLRLRMERWAPDLDAALRQLYPTADIAQLSARLLAVAARGYRDRDEDLRILDERRLLRPDWLQQPGMFGYACYTDRFAGRLLDLPAKLDYLSELGVTYLHLMPLLQPRAGDNDGGYAVADYRSVRPDLGSNDDLQALTRTLRARGISLVCDLVLNHVAREHDWAERARAGDDHYRAYFHVFPDREEPDAYERSLPEVFPDFAPGNFTWDPDLSGWVWTTFNEWQWDVNWSNPDVLCEYAEIVVHLANLGVEVLRLDAIAFTWKRLGTSCQNQPEVHALTQALRAVARIACPGVAFKAEAIVGPRDLVQYLGTGSHAGRVSELAYHNSLMVQVWSMLATGNVVLARRALAALPETPPTSTWICYVRCHDDIGWAIDDGDAHAVGLDGPSHRRFLSEWYSGDHPGSWADGLVFQENPATGDKRISGTAAALAGLSTGPTADAVNRSLARVFLAHAIIAGWGGIPVVWSGDELGQPNDPRWRAEAGHEDDNRWAHRPRLDWRLAEHRDHLSSTVGKVFQGIAHLARTRRSLPQLHAAALTRVDPDSDEGVLVIERRHPSGTMVCVYNVTDTWRPVAMDIFARAGISEPLNALSGHAVVGGADGNAMVSPYAAWWVIDTASFYA
ncbi:alpha-amylase family protein [Intrasporangium calvum]|uniref:Alpha amylase catalytic region n=1 Tax=Intrasporangium calvum (strain ATCC 23552 / DSM 43043 / JCM 3097 / NBRC 12989 / NCIMB 10167 / NRRL B-3866 / 7 KIP) TaxID=710696 RepID=E6SAP4_INTC7|nr:alpha-amylase family protein [Intrasporangium calvum]ADU48317.1 alpha amylase catalytic region [Intrasporangium calvum DSM 43043]